MLYSIKHAIAFNKPVSRRFFTAFSALNSSKDSIKVDTKLLSQLRKETQIQISKAREALQASNNNYEKALEWIRQDMLISGAKKAEKVRDRAVKEGVATTFIDQNHVSASVIQLSCETDFVSKNENFLQLSNDIARNAALLSSEKLHVLDTQNLLDSKITSSSEGITVSEAINQCISKLSENIKIHGAVGINLSNNGSNHKDFYISSYTHNSYAPFSNSGKISSLAVFKVKKELHEHPSFKKLSKRVAQQIAGYKPTHLSKTEPSKQLETDGIQTYEFDDPSQVLLNQDFMFGEGTVEQAISNVAEEIGSPIDLVSISWFEVK
ncbi:hypothetical protein BB559_002535 [Furculomyces boomerangus]|uniref:Elongation factor Ts, mitochondrial n=2 Tax=Harpellales TaxID=61421 RepID=A0A2T9YUK5_9FUNG|nr:hypothetical protein BB559_002535 [Furculomyces boomerangus]PWA01300.1 hypothetical protein BB558_002612 [Smittium angustum]